MKFFTRPVRALCVIATMGWLTAQGGIIFDNFGPGEATAVSGRVVQGPDVGTIGDVDQAVKIRMGGAYAELTMLWMGVAAVQGGSGGFQMDIREDAAGQPGALIHSAPMIVFDLPPNYIRSWIPGIVLAPNTDYWFIANGLDTFDGSWAFNSTGDQGITAGRSNGNPWNVRPIEDRYAIRLEGNLRNPVPEPSSMLQLGGGAIALIVLARKWRLAR